MPIEIAAGANAAVNVASQPSNVMIYGPPGTEKTTDAVRAFTRDGRCTAFVIPCEDGALKPILARGMPVPDHVRTPVKSWGEMQETIAWLGQNRQNYNAVIIDTISTWTMYVYKELEKAHEGNRNKFLIPLTMRNYLYMLREWTRMLGLHCVMVAHAMAPEMKDGVFYRGGPLLAPKSMIEQYHGLIDTVLRVDHLMIPGRPPTRVYWTGGEEWPSDLGALTQPMDWRGWRTKNREGCGSAVVPADLGAFLRSRTPPYAGL
jgi:hypothetical protein